MKRNALQLRRKGLLSVVVCGLLAASAKAQTGVVVTYYNGSQQNYTVSASGKMFFINGNLQIMTTDVASATSIPVSLIQKITFAAVPLPVQLLDFSLVNDKTQVGIIWKTASEVNASHFVVERSMDGTRYESIGQVIAANRTTGSSYNFNDVSPTSGVSYYRLKQVDADGKYEYSKVLTVKRSASNNIITLLPNPAAHFFIINSSSTDKLNVKIYSADGRLMMSGFYTSGEQITIGQLAPGMYIANINDKTYKLIKQ